MRGLAVAGHHRIDRITEGGDHHETVDCGRNFTEDENRTADGDHVDRHQDPAVADRLVFIDDHRDNVHAARVAALHETDADSCAGHCAAEDCRKHLIVSQAEQVAGQHALQEAERSRKEQDRINRFGSDPQADQQRTEQYEQAVDYQECDTQRYAAVRASGPVVDQQSHPVHAAAHHFGGHQDAYPGEGVHQQSHRDEEILFESSQNGLSIQLFHNVKADSVCGDKYQQDFSKRQWFVTEFNSRD